MAANGDSQTVSEYIVHHLTNLTYGKLPGGYERYDGSVVAEGGQWAMAHGADEITAMGFNNITTHHLTKRIITSLNQQVWLQRFKQCLWRVFVKGNHPIDTFQAS